MTGFQVDRPSDEWIQILTRACELARDLKPTTEGRAAIAWFNSEYSEAAVRQRREAVTNDLGMETRHRVSASQIPGTQCGKPAEVWRLSAALLDLYCRDQKWGNVECWEDRDVERVEAAKLVLVAALVIDRDAGEYLGDLIDVARLSKGEDDPLGRGYASITAGFDDGKGEWLRLLGGAVAVLTPEMTPDKSGGNNQDSGSGVRTNVVLWSGAERSGESDDAPDGRADGGREAATADIVLNEPAQEVLLFLANQTQSRARTYIADNLPKDRRSVATAVAELIEARLVEDRGKNRGVSITPNGRAWIRAAQRTA